MKLALILGDKSENIKSRLQSVKDNLYIDCFKSVPSFIDMSIKRGSIYDRVLIILSMAGEAEASDLFNYWNMTNRSSSIVFFGSSSGGTDFAKSLMHKFNSPRVSVMLVQATNMNTIAEAVLLSNQEIDAKYGVDVDLKINTNTGVTINLPEDKKPEQTAQVQAKTEEQAPKKDSGKRTLFSALLGKKDKKQPQQVQQTQGQEVKLNVQNESANNTSEVIEEEPATTMDFGYTADSESVEQYEEPTSNTGGTDYGVLTPDTSAPPVRRRRGGVSKNKKVDKKEEVTPEQNPYPSFEETMEEDIYSSVISEENATQVDEYQDYAEPIQSHQETVYPGRDLSPRTVESREKAEADFLNTLSEPTDLRRSEKYNSEQQDLVKIPNNFEADEVDLDFGGSTITQDLDRRPQRMTSVETHDVDDDLGDLGIGADEEEYRKQHETPKVVVKETVREIIRDSGRPSRLKSILKGDDPTVIVVTGDRNTGITTTALNLAAFFSKHTNVLYFDCDIDNHGVLNYINYNNYRLYEPAKLQGVKLLKDKRAFKSCICKLEDNFDLLANDFSCDATDAELDAAAEVVAEVSSDYGVVIVDCPISKLHLVEDLVMSGITILHVEASKRGMMNSLCRLEACELPFKYKKIIFNKGTRFLVRKPKNLDVTKLIKYIDSLVEPDSLDWMRMSTVNFTGKIDEKLLDTILSK